jgi:dienelactone hydrolase
MHRIARVNLSTRRQNRNAELRTEDITYIADGLRMVGHLTYDESANTRRPAVLIFPDAYGLGENAKQRAARLTHELGYVALACDLHGAQRVYTRLEEVMPLLKPLQEDASRVRARTVEAFTALARRAEVDADRIAAIGYCFGGTMCYELAMTGADVKAVVGFHSGLQVTTPADARHIKGHVLTVLGADDPVCPIDIRNEFEAMLSAGNVRWQTTLFGGVVHGFTNANARDPAKAAFARYDATADTRSWKQMRDLFEERFGS